MTALKPIENLRVRGVASERYPLNTICAHPDCTEPAVDPHHCFPRSQIGNDSWFVVIGTGSDGQVLPAGAPTTPHVAGLCRAHHDAVEGHEAWIKLEDGVFVWYNRVEVSLHPHSDSGEPWVEQWIEFGPLNPQPGSREGKTKRKKKTGEARRKRQNVTIKVPKDSEDGAALFDEALENVKAKLVKEELYSEGDLIPNYEALMAALNDWLAS